MDQNNYGSREACQRLVDAEIVLETDFVWVDIPLQKKPFNNWVLISNEEYRKVFNTCASYPALSMSEVWRELPDTYSSREIAYLRIAKLENGDTVCGYLSYKEPLQIYQNINPTDALIDLLIWVRKEKP